MFTFYTISLMLSLVVCPRNHKVFSKLKTLFQMKKEHKLTLKRNHGKYLFSCFEFLMLLWIINFSFIQIWILIFSFEQKVRVTLESWERSMPQCNRNTRRGVAPSTSTLEFRSLIRRLLIFYFLLPSSRSVFVNNNFNQERPEFVD